MDRGLSLKEVEIFKSGYRLLGCDQEIAPGEVLTVMGPSGVGKSTLLSFIIGTLGSDFDAKGEVWLDGRNITQTPPRERRVGILFQEDLLFAHLSVAQNLAFGLTSKVKTRKDRKERITQALSEIGLEGFANRDPATLSGGQKARVSLMRMLLSEPCALLLDEPFSRLDAALRAQMRSLVFDTARARALPVVMVTHDKEDAKAAGGALMEIVPT
ncbi:MAG: ATP-binding cassette domain-containing protein [Pseudomonadota bacterium]